MKIAIIGAGGPDGVGRGGACEPLHAPTKTIAISGRMNQSRCTSARRAISLPTEITATPITMTSSAAT